MFEVDCHSLFVIVNTSRSVVGDGVVNPLNYILVIIRIEVNSHSRSFSVNISGSVLGIGVVDLVVFIRISLFVRTCTQGSCQPCCLFQDL